MQFLLIVITFIRTMNSKKERKFLTRYLIALLISTQTRLKFQASPRVQINAHMKENLHLSMMKWILILMLHNPKCNSLLVFLARDHNNYQRVGYNWFQEGNSENPRRQNLSRQCVPWKQKKMVMVFMGIWWEGNKITAIFEWKFLHRKGILCMRPTQEPSAWHILQ